MGDIQGEEAQAFVSVPEGNLHWGSCPVLLKGGHRSPDVWELRRRSGIADPEEAPQIRSPLLFWRHCLPLHDALPISGIGKKVRRLASQTTHLRELQPFLSTWIGSTVG